MSQVRSTYTLTLGAELERDRLQRRVSSLTVATDLLRRYEGWHRRQAPRHVRHAIADFEAQLAAMNARLRELALDAGSTTDEDEIR